MAWLQFYDLDPSPGYPCRTFRNLEAMKDTIAEQCDCLAEDVRIDDRYDETGDCVEFVTVQGLGDVGTLDRTVPAGFVAIEG